MIFNNIIGDHEIVADFAVVDCSTDESGTVPGPTAAKAPRATSQGQTKRPRCWRKSKQTLSCPF